MRISAAHARRSHSLFLLALAGGLATAQSASAADAPTLRFIAPPEGYRDSFGAGVSSDGRTVMVNTGEVSMYTITMGATGVWTDYAQGGSLTMLPNPPGAAVCIGRALSADGLRLMADVPDDASDVHGFGVNARWSWSVEGGWMQIEELSGSIIPSRTGAAAIVRGVPLSSASVWMEAGEMGEVGSMTALSAPGGTEGLYGLNVDGSVVVGYQNLAPARWTAAGGWESLTTADLGAYAPALCCSDDGTTIVGRGTGPGETWNRLWWWDESRGAAQWIERPQFDIVNVSMMSGSGRAAVGNRARRAVVVTRANGVIDLNVYVQGRGIDTAGRELGSATAVAESADGTLTIVGTALNGDYPQPVFNAEAFVLTMRPCPADVGSVGGVAGGDGLLDNNDFVAFIDDFFSQLAVADRGGAGGVAQPDGMFDTNDFVVFIDQFFAGCP